jgi:hypothetical protein
MRLLGWCHHAAIETGIVCDRLVADGRLALRLVSVGPLLEAFRTAIFSDRII